jgi:NTE family protein
MASHIHFGKTAAYSWSGRWRGPKTLKNLKRVVGTLYADAYDCTYPSAASLLAASAFSPIPESQTRFLPQFRAFNYAAGGARALISLRDRLELRLEAYVFQPYQEILNTNNTAEFGSPFAKRYFLGSAALVLQTPLAPLALSFNYLDQQEKPYTLLFTAGFLLYNKRAMD